MILCVYIPSFFFSSRRRHTRFDCDWSSDVCSSDLGRLRSDTALVRDAHTTLAVEGNSTSDRKSTRLNSSHSQISYAVFCLKKKNFMSQTGAYKITTSTLSFAPITHTFRLRSQSIRL